MEIAEIKYSMKSAQSTSFNMAIHYMQFIIFFTSSDVSVPNHGAYVFHHRFFFLSYGDHEVDFVIGNVIHLYHLYLLLTIPATI